MSKHRPDHRPAAPPQEAAPTPPEGAWWNNIRRAWLVEGEAGPVALDPQPAPPVAQPMPPVVHVPLATRIDY